VSRDLVPLSLSELLGRIVREWERDRRILDLPAGRFWRRDPGVDLSDTVMGHPVATPLGPAAGPHTQLAGNIVLGWLAGGRVFELKTVQALDELEIPRPCIDMATVGYNVEWSQELTLDESLREYARAHLALAILGRWEPLREVLGEPGPHLFELSVGYDLEGLQGEKMTRFLERAADIADLVDGLREEVPAPLRHLADVPVPSRLAAGTNLSTFHGCPPEEIEGIVRHLIDAHDLDVTVKLNPTLLGYERVRAILHDRLGYAHVELDRDAFAADLQLDRAVTMLTGLADHAAARGRRLGIKLTNTLVVRNPGAPLPGETRYLSGPPLHVLAVELLSVLEEALPGRLATAGGEIPVAFSAGIDERNVAAAVGCGLSPVTSCSSLLKPAGYGGLQRQARALATALREAGCRDLAAWRARARGAARTAGHATAAAAYAARLAGTDAAAPYAAAAVEKPPRRVDRRLALWDCSSCNLCVSVCPNDAMLRLGRPDELADRLERRWQFLCLADLCNDCGNCTTFCPETGAPHRDKPRLYLRKEAPATEGHYRLAADGDRWRVDGAPDAAIVAGIVNGEKGLALRPAEGS